jgi:hypothetical protein
MPERLLHLALRSAPHADKPPMPDPIPIGHEITILCEGAADQNFIKELIKERGGFPPIDFLPADRFYGRSSFDRMLIALKGTGDPFSRVKGVLIIADSHDVPNDTFAYICEQIRSVPDFPVPRQLLKPAPATPGHPSVAIMLLPDESTPGALESLFAQELENKHKWVTACLDAYLKCGQITAHQWTPEKHAKARYHSMVAALHHADPSRSASTTFTSNPPVMSTKACTFDSVEKRIKDFCSAIV